MRIAFKFKYIHDNGLFLRLFERISEKSELELTLRQNESKYTIEATGEQPQLENLAELISTLVPQSLFLFDHSIEEVTEENGSIISSEEAVSSYKIPYCPECQERIIRTLDPFEPCGVCDDEKRLSKQEIEEQHQIESDTPKELFQTLAQKLIKDKELTLLTYKGMRHFSLLSENTEDGSGILICDPSDLSSSFVITQDELDTLMMLEKPTIRLKPKIKLRAEYELSSPFYSVFLADDKITLALSLALAEKGVFALFSDLKPDIRAASALKEHVIIQAGGDMLPWKHMMPLEHAATCRFDGFSAYGDRDGLVLDEEFEVNKPCIVFTHRKEEASKERLYFQPAHAAMRSVVLEHELQGRSLCGIYLSREHDSQIFSFSSKIGYTPLAEFSYDIPTEARLMLESIAQMDDQGERLLANYRRKFPKLYEKIEQASFEPDEDISMITRLWAMAALVIGLSEGGKIERAALELEATALEFNGKSGPRIDYKVRKADGSYQVDPRLAIRSAMSFKLAGVDDYLLSFGFIDSLADFIAQQAEMADANISIEGVSLCGSLFENRQLLMRTYNAITPNYKIYRNQRLSIDGANVPVGAITLGSE